MSNTVTIASPFGTVTVTVLSALEASFVFAPGSKINGIAFRGSMRVSRKPLELLADHDQVMPWTVRVSDTCLRRMEADSKGESTLSHNAYDKLRAWVEKEVSNVVTSDTVNAAHKAKAVELRDKAKALVAKLEAELVAARKSLEEAEALAA